MSLDLPAPKPLFLDAAHIPARRGEVPNLDGMRAASILLVMLGHFVDGQVFPGGLGVLVFFIISGFLITRLLFDEHKTTGHINLKLFYIRRMLRLYPVVVVYTLTMCVVLVAKGGSVRLAEVGSVLFYYANYYFQFGDHAEGLSLPVGIFWSLAIEEHFYIVFPLLLCLMSCKPRTVVAGMIAISLLALTLRISGAYRHPEYLNSHYFYMRSELRMDTLATGVLLAALCEIPFGRSLLLRLNRNGVTAFAVTTLLACLCFRDVWFRETLRYTLLDFSVAMLIVNILFSNRYLIVNKVLNSPAALALGRLSYSLYVWHFGIGFSLPLGNFPFWQKVLILFTLSLSAAVLSFYLIEQPFLILRQRFGSVRRDAADLSPQTKRAQPTSGLSGEVKL